VEVSFLLVFVMVGVAVIVTGVHLRRYPEQPRDFFRGRAPSVFGPRLGPRISDRIYTTEGMRVAGLAWILAGIIFVAVGLFLIIGLLMRG
jgi:hypothetical protein